MSSATADALSASYAACRRRTRLARSSFHAGFLLLPGPKRRAMEALYAFARESDDLVDSDEPLQRRAENLARWRRAVEKWLHCTDATLGARREPCLDCGDERPGAAAAVDEPPAADILPALADTAERYAIPREHFLAVLDGVEMDLTRSRYETYEELTEYCRRVASAVGLASVHIWGFAHPQAACHFAQPADHCGLAFQLTNILRDLREDVRRDRVYLPQEDLRAVGYTVDDLRAGIADERFEKLMRQLIARARAHYDRAAELDRFLHRDGQPIYGLMRATYRALLERVADDPTAVLHRRVRLPRWRKLVLLGRWAVWPRRKSSS